MKINLLAPISGRSFAANAAPLCLMGCIAVFATALHAQPAREAASPDDEVRQLQLMLMLHQNGSVPMMPRLPQVVGSAGLESSRAHFAYAHMEGIAAAPGASESGKPQETRK